MYGPERHHRRSIRLRGYDYSQAGAYFVTVGVQDRLTLFGDAVDGKMRPNDAGRMLERWWDEVHRAFPGSATDAFVVMPNHLHGIVVLGAIANGRGSDEGAHVGAPLPRTVHDGRDGVGADPRVCPASLATVVQWFKTMTTNDYIRGVKQQGWTTFPGKLWQRNYFERILRSDAALDRARQYVLDNPANWSQDAEHPDRWRP